MSDDDMASCDCCDEMVSHDDIGRCVAYGIETYACGRCRGEPQPDPSPTDHGRTWKTIGKEFLE